ncbi:MAG: hypothetical protein AAGC93_16970 [Cyanobacteria bacterium P01_F01_bin.53]
MISQPISQPISRPTKLLFGTLLGLMAFGGTAQKASANPLQALPIVGDLIEATRPAPPLPSELDFFHDNVQGNNVNVCALTCGPLPGAAAARPPQARPQGIPQGIPQGARPPQGIPQGARPPQARPQGIPQGIPQGARPPQGAASAPRPGNQPKVTVNVPPINIPL